MVIISRIVIKALHAYPTSPLSPAMVRTTQHGFYDATYARYGNPQVTLAIHDRPEFHGLSHFDMRNFLDSEGLLDAFVVIDERTPQLDAVWYVESTEYCKSRSDPSPAVIPHPGESYTLWHAHMQVGDVPISAISWDVGCGELEEAVLNMYYPYDSNDPQNTIISMGLNWTDPKTALGMLGDIYIKANGTEVEWSTDPDIRKRWLPQPPAVARLTPEAARDYGLLQTWSWQSRIARLDEEVNLTADYDANSPLWPREYPDDDILNIGADRNRELQTTQPPKYNILDEARSSANRQQLVSNVCRSLELRGATNTTRSSSVRQGWQIARA
ncbi:MAG: hypothetical protein Q9222_004182 [Ikaeria aurantiellina]